ncbi:MAG: UvrD-helicase domain-containing protein, partial [Candidatus Brocadiales bacterium]|nr:UvrD-helicase domain-containing protein [Candidatus Brocadiales bacterium]
MNILDNITDAQKEAITHIDGPLLVIAGAGSGKTRVITRRVGYLVEKGIDPANILSITFTNKAANEMKERLGEFLDLRGMW